MYDESLHGEKLRKELDLSHLPIGLRRKVYALLQKYWSVFDDKGQFIPVKDYKCVRSIPAAPDQYALKISITAPAKYRSCVSTLRLSRS